MLRCLVSRVTCHAVWGRSYVTTTQLAGVLLSDAQLLEIIQPLLSYREIKDNLSFGYVSFDCPKLAQGEFTNL